MRVALLPVLVVALMGALLGAAGAPAKDQPGTTYVDTSAGYRITIPAAWQLVPPSLAGVKQRIAELKKQKKTQLAGVYSEMISTATGRKQLSTFRFRAFRWPQLPSPVPTDVTLSIQPVPARFKATDLPAIGASFRKNLASPGAKIDPLQMLKLPAGTAAVVTGTVPLRKPYQAYKTGFSLVLLLKPGKLYILSFRIDSAVAGDAKVFASIAKLFRFV